MMHYKGKDVRITSLTDISKRKEEEAALIKLNRLFEFSSMINNMVLRNKKREQLFADICNIAVTVGNFRMAWIGMIDQETGSINPVKWDGYNNGYLEKIKKITVKNTAEGKGPGGRAAREGEIFICQDIENDPTMKPWRDEAIKRGYYSGISLPIKVRENTIGIFTLYAGEKDFFSTKEESELLEKATNNIAFALENILKEEERIAAVIELKKSEATFKSVVQNSLNLILLSDVNDCLLFISPQCKEVIGFSGDTLLGKTLPVNIHPDDVEHLINKWSSLKNKGEIISHHEYRIIDSDDKTRWISQSAKPVIVDGTVLCYQSSLRNITERKLNDLALKESEMKYQFIVEKSDDILWVMDGDLKFEYVSPSVINVLGYTPEEHMLQGLDEYMTPESAEMIKSEFMDGAINLMKKDFAKLRTNVELEVKLIRKDKTIRDAKITLLIARDEHFHISKIRGKTTDITEEKNAEKLTVLSNKVLGILNGNKDLKGMIEAVLEKIQETTNFSAIGIRLKNGNDFPYLSQIGFSDEFLLTGNSLIHKNSHGKQCKDEKGNVLLECSCGMVLNGIKDKSKKFLTEAGSFWTNNSCPLLDISPEHEPRLNPRNRCAHEGYESIAIIPIKTNNIIVGTLQLNHKKRDAFTKDMINHFENMCLSIGNALMRKLAEDAMEESETNLSAIFDNTNTGFILLDTQFSILSFNNRASELAKLAFGKGFQINKKLVEYLPLQKQKLFSAALSKVITGNETRYDISFPQNDGSDLWLDLMLKPVINDDKKIVGVSVGLLNLTKTKIAEQEREKLIKELSDKNNELMQFNYIVSHNLRAPLTNLQGLSNLFSIPGSSEEEKMKIVEHMKHAVNNMDVLIKDLHVILSTRSAINITKEKVVIKTLLKSISNTLELQINEADCVIKTTISKNAAQLFTVKSYVESIIYNLISNAIKYRSNQRKLQIDVSFKKEKNSYIITVSDNGIGIDMDIHGNYIFGLYKRFHLKVEGKGLGLHMTKTQVEAIGGKISVESKVNRGTIFTIVLPVSEQVVSKEAK